MSTNTHVTVAAVVLAAGRSKRMGKQKLLMPFRGEPLIAPVLRAAVDADAGGYPLFWPVVAVTAPYSSPELLGVLRNSSNVHTVTAAHADEGMAHSLRAGLEEVLRVSGAAPPAGVCVLLGDQPLVDSALLRRLRDAFVLAPEAFAVPVHQGQRGNPVIIPASFFSAVASLFGDTGARSLFLRAHGAVRTVEAGSPAVLTDVDTPEAYRDLCLAHGR